MSNNVQTVATGAEEMSASISEIAINSTKAAQIPSEAVEVAIRTNETISTLGESSKEIGEIVKEDPADKRSRNNEFTLKTYKFPFQEMMPK